MTDHGLIIQRGNTLFADYLQYSSNFGSASEQRMDLPSAKVFDVLGDHGIRFIYHANSVITSCQFLRTSALLSRGAVERKGLYQTKQQSDEADHRYSLWFDVFTDSVDIHDRASCANVYGPVLFVINLEELRKKYTGRVWLTKLNPTKWKGTSEEQRWFRSKEELAANFVRGEFDQMIVFRHSGGELPIGHCLEKLILDDPGLEAKGSLDYYSMAYGALRLAMTEGGIQAKIQKRRCDDSCRCKNSYQANTSRAKVMYLPRISD